MTEAAKYVPEYVKEQILVCFKMALGKGFAEYLATLVGCTLSEEKYDSDDDIFIFKTEEGKEKEACDKFEEYGDFVEWADLRDRKLEARWHNLEAVLDEVQDLYDCAELPDEEYAKKIEEIINMLKKSKKSAE